ncbi:pentatricopeptide repeat-containing protein At5g67570, chloroplastic-like [Diospyros lotus]|uniref:pentatricopeptide repeat-containing protein At5g67570, chloroplastic-like n=1 Tax=Diospyros lotus TaxID=55363 RepID=UPI0022564D86|nr:pentatricopeptide repeat-containing protein At5g67570, chloroplastic-like [Diospyros lotus]
MEEGWLEEEKRNWAPAKRSRSEAETIRFLVDKLSCTELNVKDWKFSRMMKQSGLQFTEGQLLKLVEGLGDKGKWRHALSVVHWVYSQKERRHYKSRFVFTKLLAVLGKARRTCEALKIFDLMLEHCQTYPDMAAYHSIAVTLGQAGLLKKLLNIVECMREKPTKRIKNMRSKNWDPALQPDLVVFNAVLNACVPSHQWKGVSWVFEQLRKNGLKPNGATYGLAMEVMLHSGKYDLVHEFFGKMRRSGEAPKALTYKVLVRAFWEQGKVEEAVQAVRDMEQRGVVGTPCVYYELACCLCSYGRWQEALMEVEKLKKRHTYKPLEVTFTGMIKSSMDAGHIQDCISIFQHTKDHCMLDIGIINIMLKVYGRNDMFSKAKDLFEEAKRTQSDSTSSPDGYGYSLVLDTYTYSTMLEASACALQWEYFEYVYREMVLSGYLLHQSKHALLLVEASIAGKWHLLEHTFDTMLEAGEIPHPSFFTELMCQAVIQHDYERVVNIIKAMAYALFQVSEQQWIDLLERNRDRISQDSLRDMLETLSSCDLPIEATVSNLSRSLLSHCRPDDQRGDPTVDCPSLDHSSLAADNGNIVHRVADADPKLGFSNHNCNGDAKAKLFPNLEYDLAFEMASDEFADDSDDELPGVHTLIAKAWTTRR